jgi:hypothetical protein
MSTKNNWIIVNGSAKQHGTQNYLFIYTEWLKMILTTHEW